ncbi:MAG: Trm112 family protein [Terracidiphilus sp.]
MPASPEKPIPPDFSAWSDQLVCPACLQPLRFAPDQIVCTACGRTYPVIDGIPVLIADRA